MDVSDIIAIIAIAISGLALVVSTTSAFYTRRSARAAEQNSERDRLRLHEAREPLLDFRPPSGPKLAQPDPVVSSLLGLPFYDPASFCITVLLAGPQELLKVRVREDSEDGLDGGEWLFSKSDDRETLRQSCDFVARKGREVSFYVFYLPKIREPRLHRRLPPFERLSLKATCTEERGHEHEEWSVDVTLTLVWKDESTERKPRPLGQQSTEDG